MLTPGEAVECQVEIIATSMVFKKGHKIRLDISPADGVGTQHFTHHHSDYNQGGVSTIHSGGDKQTWLMLPIIPPK
jgi:predicted acyl esterase